MKKVIKTSRAIKATSDDMNDPEVHDVCMKLLELVDKGIITDDEYDDIREILHRYQDR